MPRILLIDDDDVVIDTLGRLPNYTFAGTNSMERKRVAR
jgi:hypothetical protein